MVDSAWLILLTIINYSHFRECMEPFGGTESVRDNSDSFAGRVTHCGRANEQTDMPARSRPAPATPVGHIQEDPGAGEGVDLAHRAWAKATVQCRNWVSGWV